MQKKFNGHFMRTRCVMLFCGLSLLATQIFAQSPFTAIPKTTGYTVVFYNVENLYDTVDDPRCNDSEYLAAAANQWNSEKYLHKLEQISLVLSSVDSLSLPSIIGLAEIENKSVLRDLSLTNALKKGKYKIIHEDSRDPRGIDVALLYKPSAFRELWHQKIPIKYDTSSERSARECLYVCGILGKKDTLHLIVNHWKSRSGGTEETEEKRIMYALAIRHIVDSLFNCNNNAQIVLMGDFNDNPSDVSMTKNLQALPYTGKLEYHKLYNLCYDLPSKGIGSLYFKGWDLFDQIIVSTSLLMQKNTGILSDTEATIYKRDWMCYRNSRDLMVPNRTYAAGKYFGGFSDHLPVTIKLWLLR